MNIGGIGRGYLSYRHGINGAFVRICLISPSEAASEAIYGDRMESLFVCVSFWF